MEDPQKHYTGGEIKKARQSSAMGLIIRQKEPTDLETPFDRVDSFLTPTELFYIRSHFPAPQLDLASYQLRIDGAVRNPLSLSRKELRDMPSEARVATLECGGNGRVFLIPQSGSHTYCYRRGSRWLDPRRLDALPVSPAFELRTRVESALSKKDHAHEASHDDSLVR